MSYEERLKRLLENNDPFWYTTMDNFIKETYENEEQGINDIEKLAKDTTKFNEFAKQIIQKKNDKKSVKVQFFSDAQKKENVDTTTEKCLCGNVFELNWSENQKFQMVRCPQCDNEIKFKNPNLNLGMVCPNCNEKLTFLMPGGTRLYCNNCNKYYMNNGGTVGKETTSPYINKDALY